MEDREIKKHLVAYFCGIFLLINLAHLNFVPLRFCHPRSVSFNGDNDPVFTIPRNSTSETASAVVAFTSRVLPNAHKSTHVLFIAEYTPSKKDDPHADGSLISFFVLHCFYIQWLKEIIAIIII